MRKDCKGYMQSQRGDRNKGVLPCWLQARRRRQQIHDSSSAIALGAMKRERISHYQATKWSNPLLYAVLAVAGLSLTSLGGKSYLLHAKPANDESTFTRISDLVPERIKTGEWRLRVIYVASDEKRVNIREVLTAAASLLRAKLDENVSFILTHQYKLSTFLLKGQQHLKGRETQRVGEPIQLLLPLNAESIIETHGDFLPTLATASCNFFESNCPADPKSSYERAISFVDQLSGQLNEKGWEATFSAFWDGMWAFRAEADIFITDAVLAPDMVLFWSFDTHRTGRQDSAGFPLFVSFAAGRERDTIRTDLAGWMLARLFAKVVYGILPVRAQDPNSRGCLLVVDDSITRAYERSMQSHKCKRDIDVKRIWQLERFARYHIQRKAWDEAEELYDQLKDEDPLMSVLGLADIYALQGEYDLAIQLLESYLRELDRKKETIAQRDYLVESEVIKAELLRKRKQVRHSK